MLEPLMVAPFAALVKVSRVPTVFTPVPPVEVATQALPFQIKLALVLGAMVTPYMVKGWLPLRLLT
jgi:hypothetical protein